MSGPDDEAEAIALFSMQMLVHVARNLVSTGTIPADTLKVNVDQTRTHLASLHPRHTAAFDTLAATLISGIESADQWRKTQSGGG